MVSEEIHHKFIYVIWYSEQEVNEDNNMEEESRKNAHDQLLGL